HVGADARGHFVEFIHFERQVYAPFGAQHVDEQGMPRAFGAFKQKSGPAGLGHAIGDLGDFEDGVDFGGDALQFALFLQFVDECAQIAIGHSGPLRRRINLARKVVLGDSSRWNRGPENRSGRKRRVSAPQWGSDDWWRRYPAIYHPRKLCATVFSRAGVVQWQYR